MQESEMSDYINEDWEQENNSRSNQDGNRQTRSYTYFTERRTCQLLLLSFGVLCVIQGTLNVSLRLSLYHAQMSEDCNVTVFNYPNKEKKENVNCEQEKSGQCNELQEKFNAVTGDKNALENSNIELINRINSMTEENERLKMQLRALSGCVSQQQCPPTWRQINTKCYFLSSEMKTWEESRMYCRSKGADLVIINSEQEQRDVYRLNGDQFLLFWIGLHHKNGSFQWVDGSKPTKFFWQEGQPDEGGPKNTEACVEMYHQNPELRNWNDAPCGQKRNWLCETDLCLNLRV